MSVQTLRDATHYKAALAKCKTNILRHQVTTATDKEIDCRQSMGINTIFQIPFLATWRLSKTNHSECNVKQSACTTQT